MHFILLPNCTSLLWITFSVFSCIFCCSKYTAFRITQPHNFHQIDKIWHKKLCKKAPTYMKISSCVTLFAHCLAIFGCRSGFFDRLNNNGSMTFNRFSCTFWCLIGYNLQGAKSFKLFGNIFLVPYLLIKCSILLSFMHHLRNKTVNV